MSSFFQCLVYTFTACDTTVHTVQVKIVFKKYFIPKPSVTSNKTTRSQTYLHVLDSFILWLSTSLMYFGVVFRSRHSWMTFIFFRLSFPSTQNVQGVRCNGSRVRLRSDQGQRLRLGSKSPLDRRPSSICALLTTDAIYPGDCAGTQIG
jgi:hypothetical protein